MSLDRDSNRFLFDALIRIFFKGEDRIGVLKPFLNVLSDQGLVFAKFQWKTDYPVVVIHEIVSGNLGPAAAAHINTTVIEVVSHDFILLVAFFAANVQTLADVWFCWSIWKYSREIPVVAFVFMSDPYTKVHFNHSKSL